MLHRDDRGLAVGIVAFVALISIVLLWVLLNGGMEIVFDTADSQTTDATAESEIATAEKIWGLLPFYLLFLGVMMLVARAVLESRRPSP
jgi:hypothetical protein